jgi:outer membrane protein TolC
MNPWHRHCLVVVISLLTAVIAGAQDAPATPPLQFVQPQGSAAPPVVVTLQDALDRARSNDAQFRSVVTDVETAREDRVQAKSSLLPALSHTTQYLGTQSNGVLPSGRFVTNDGVHVFRSWAVVRQELSPNTLSMTPYRRAQAAELLAGARLEVAQRGLAVTVTRIYYALVTAERRYASAQQAAQQARRFFDTSQQRQRLGEVARSDVVKAEIQYQQQQQSFQEATLAMENARLSLAVLLFPTLTENFAVVDDLSAAPALPPFSEARAMAERQNPDVRAATAAVDVAHQDVRSARHAFLPSIAIDAVYGIEANRFALRSVVDAAPQAGELPNLGYFVTANLTVPVWDWGGLRSKLRQTETRERQAQVGVSQAQRQLLSNLYSMYNEALAARAAVDTLQHVVDLAAESLRLTNLRYEAGESSALEVVDAQNTLVQARNAYDDAGSRYRVSLASLQTVTGSF